MIGIRSITSAFHRSIVLSSGTRSITSTGSLLSNTSHDSPKSPKDSNAIVKNSADSQPQSNLMSKSEVDKSKINSSETKEAETLQKTVKRKNIIPPWDPNRVVIFPRQFVHDKKKSKHLKQLTFVLRTIPGYQQCGGTPYRPKKATPDGRYRLR